MTFPDKNSAQRCSADWYSLHHGLGSFLQARGETPRNVGRARLSKKTLSVYSAQLGLHILTPWDKTGTKTLKESFKGSSDSAAVPHFGQQGAAADLLSVEAGTSPGEGSVLELCPDIL